MRSSLTTEGGIFSYRTNRGAVLFGVRLRIHGKLWQRQGFPTKTAAKQCRDKVRADQALGAFSVEAYRQHDPVTESTPSTTAGPHIYFLQPEAGGPVKIGFSRNVHVRLETLRRMGAQRLRLLGTIPGTLADERALHEQFTKARRHGEWFELAPPLVRFLVERGMRPLVSLPADQIIAEHMASSSQV